MQAQLTFRTAATRILGASVLGLVLLAGSPMSAPAQAGIGAPVTTGAALSQATPSWWANILRVFRGDKDKEEESRRHVIIGLDISKSNPLVDDRNFATAVANYVRDEIEDMPKRSKLNLRTFGVDDAKPNPLRLNRVITNPASATRASRLFRTLIASVPDLVDRGRVEAQDYTNILSFMNNMSKLVDCERFETTIILATDGIEDSEFVRLKNANASLPSPTRQMFSGCDKLLMLGVGQGAGSPRLTARLDREWTRWAKEAGFERFVGLNNW